MSLNFQRRINFFNKIKLRFIYIKKFRKNSFNREEIFLFINGIFDHVCGRMIINISHLNLVTKSRYFKHNINGKDYFTAHRPLPESSIMNAWNIPIYYGWKFSILI